MKRLPRRLVLIPGLAVVVVAIVVPLTAEPASGACANPVACENALPGDPPSDWQVSGIGNNSLAGFATSFSVDIGQTVSFKINNLTGSPYHVDILRLGWYGGDGARKLASNLSATSTVQPGCATDSSTGLVDCGNWSVSASWTVPSSAVSGVYIAHLVPNGCTGNCGSQIPFVVRNDTSHSAILLSTSDATWEAYNDGFGNSLYSCTNGCSTTSPPGGKPQPAGYTGAYAVSYNRPFDGGFATDNGASYLWYAEYQMIRFMERNGYDVSYTSSSDVDRDGALLLNHNVFMSSGHDEYWSAGQRANVTYARDHGVNLAFFSGNEVFWKTRWANNYRTLITYKETHFLDAPGSNQSCSARPDPADPPTWSGAWADPRGAQCGADGGQPQNALTGQLFIVNAGTSSIQVPYQYSRLSIWRNTSIAGLTPGGSDTLGDQTLGYEWDINDNTDNSPLGQEAAAFRPPGQIELSQTTVPGVQAFTDYGTNVSGNNSTETHHLTLYRAPSGALVFGAGTVQWAWGLDNTNAWSNAGPPGDSVDPDMQQATVNLLAMMGAQPATLMSGLVLGPGCGSIDTIAPTSTITSTSGGTVTGTARDAGGGNVAAVEVSTDGGSTWHPANLTTPAGPTVSWTYAGSGTHIQSRATNDSGYTQGISYASNGCGSGSSAGQGQSPSHDHPAHRRLAKAASISVRKVVENAHGQVVLWIRNPNYVRALGRVKLTARLAGIAARARTTVIGNKRFNAPARRKVKVTILLSKQARRYLTKHKYLKTRVVIVLSSGGTSKTSSATITVAAPRPGGHQGGRPGRR